MGGIGEGLPFGQDEHPPSPRPSTSILYGSLHKNCLVRGGVSAFPSLGREQRGFIDTDSSFWLSLESLVVLLG